MHGSYDDMMDWKYREENPGYEREIGLTAGDLDDCDPEVAALVAETYARDNAARRERNHRTEVAALRALLEENGIEIPDHL
jgi:hypothetical protein